MRELTVIPGVVKNFETGEIIGNVIIGAGCEMFVFPTEEAAKRFLVLYGSDPEKTESEFYQRQTMNEDRLRLRQYEEREAVTQEAKAAVEEDRRRPMPSPDIAEQPVLATRGIPAESRLRRR